MLPLKAGRATVHILEGVVFLVLFSVLAELISIGNVLANLRSVSLRRKVNIVAPRPPPRSIDDKLLLPEQAKVSLVNVWIRDVAQLLIILLALFKSFLSMVQH